MKLNKKCLSAVVATALLLVVAVTAIVSFQSWYSGYQGEIFADVEVKGSYSGMVTGINNMIAGYIYFLNTELSDINITGIKINGVDCSFEDVLSTGIHEISVSSCANYTETSVFDVVVYTDKKIYSKKLMDKSSSSLSGGEGEEGGEGGPTGSFITVWNTSLAAGDGVTLPLIDIGTYDFVVDWGDGNTSVVRSWNSVNNSHTYSPGGTYTVNITGTIEGFNFDWGVSGDKRKLIEIQSWGPLVLGGYDGHFYDCRNLQITATDAPDLSQTTDFFNIFYYNFVLNADLDNWDTSTITNMSYAFYAASDFNGSIGSWNTSSVLDMERMFTMAELFNKNIDTWDVSSVKNMESMFESAYAFDQDLNSWDVSSVTNMIGMFGDSYFNGNISLWNTSSLVSPQSMFNGAYEFDQDINGWNMSSVTTLYNMFYAASKFNQDLNSWDTSSVTIMQNVFGGATLFNGSIANWNTSSVNNMVGTFYNAANFNRDISGWNTSLVTTMNTMFYGASKFNQNLSGWDVGIVSIHTNFDTLATSWEAGNKPSFP